MLSIDFTDSQAKIVTGMYSKQGVNISNATTVAIPDGAINNGFIIDIPKICTELQQAVKANQIKEKDVVISISSNQVVFKEMDVPGGDQLDLRVNNQMKADMGISDEYNISYTIVGRHTDDSGKETITVFATACPQKLVDGYISLIETMGGLNLVGVNITSSCISRILASEPSMASRMPLMVVQVEKSFINLNIYNMGQLVFSRYVNVDQTELKLTDNYLEKTTYENVFRTIQFFNAQHDEQIKEVLLYGFIENSEVMTKAIGQLDVSVGMLLQPPMVSGFSGFDFNVYANAAGAIFKRNKDTEHINLLESLSEQSKSQSNLFFGILGIVFLGSIILIGLVYLYNFLMIKNDEKKIDDIEAYISQKQPELNEITLLEETLSIAQNYEVMSGNLRNAYKTKPIIEKDVFSKIESTLASQGGTLKSASYTSSGMVLTIETTTQVSPSNFSEALDKLKYFDKVNYNGYSTDENNKTTHTITVLVKGGEGDAQ